jgi:hypothetical protein
MTNALRPLRLAELLSRTFSSYRRHFWLFVGIALPAWVLPAVGEIVLPSSSGANYSIQIPHRAAVGLPALRVLRVESELFVLLVTGLLVTQLITYTIPLGATALALSEVSCDRSISIRASYKRLGARIGPLIGLVLRLVLIGLGACSAAVLTAGFLGMALAIIVLLALESQLRYSVTDWPD